MKTLFIDTHASDLCIALVEGKEVFKKVLESNRGHSEVAIETLKSVLESAKCEIKDVDEIIVVNGPGSFTGVRIGVTIAKTIAYSLNIPIKTITSLEEFAVSSNTDFDIVAVYDSKGAYSAKKMGNTFVDFEYRKKSDFDQYIRDNNYKVLDENHRDFIKIVEYMKDKDTVVSHKANPIYIKEIEVLK